MRGLELQESRRGVHEADRPAVGAHQADRLAQHQLERFAQIQRRMDDLADEVERFEAVETVAEQLDIVVHGEARGRVSARAR